MCFFDSPRFKMSSETLLHYRYNCWELSSSWACTKSQDLEDEAMPCPPQLTISFCLPFLRFLQTVIGKLNSGDWVLVCQGMLDFRRLAKFHPEEAAPLLWDSTLFCYVHIILARTQAKWIQTGITFYAYSDHYMFACLHVFSNKRCFSRLSCPIKNSLQLK